MSQPPTVLWRITDLSRYLGRSTRWISYALARAEDQLGSIPCYRLPGGAPRFDPAEIEAWVKAGCLSVADFRQSRKGAAS